MGEEYINEEKDVAQKNNVEEEGMEVSELKVYEKEAGVSSYVYIALIVLVIVFAIFMFIIFRR